MPKKALLITVGGTKDPIINSIKTIKPDLIYFICSSDKNKERSSESLITDIIKEANYKNKYKIIGLKNPDDFEKTFQEIKKCTNSLKNKKYEINVDFTGGTKIMTSALSIFSALDFDIKPFLTTGPRKDLEKVKGESTTRNIESQINEARIEFFLKEINLLISKNLYYSALELLQELLKRNLNKQVQKELEEKEKICKGFLYWDNFQYEKSFEILKNYGKKFPKELNDLLKILGKTKNNGYEPVFDLISNAKRQAKNGFYDNAVSRLYRAVELFAQTRLKKEYQIETNHLEKSLNKLKDPKKWEEKKNDEGEIKIGVKDDWELLFELGDPMGKIYNNIRKQFIDKLKIRNESKLAHGDTPVDEKKWNEFLDFFDEFIKECCKEAKIKKEEIIFPEKI